MHEDHHPPLMTEVIAIGLPLLGLVIGYLFYGKQIWSAKIIAESSIGKPVFQFFNSGWAMDWLYNLLLVKPYVGLAKINRKDVVDLVPKLLVFSARKFNGILVQTQNGQLRYYLATMATASVVVIVLAVYWI